MIRGRYRIEVQAVFSLHDMFTGKGISSGTVRFRLPEGGRITVKDGGFYVVTGCREREIKVTIESPCYETAVIRQTVGKGPVEIQKIWLSPGKAYPVRKEALVIRGEADAGSGVRVAVLDQGQAIRFLHDYDPKKDGEGFPAYYVGGLDLEGRPAAAVTGKKNGRQTEFVRIVQMDEKKGICRLEAPLSGKMKKTETELYPVYTGTADAGGIYEILIPRQDEGMGCLIWFRKGNRDMTEEKTVSGTAE